MHILHTFPFCCLNCSISWKDSLFIFIIIFANSRFTCPLGHEFTILMPECQIVFTSSQAERVVEFQEWWYATEYCGFVYLYLLFLKGNTFGGERVLLHHLTSNALPTTAARSLQHYRGIKFLCSKRVHRLCCLNAKMQLAIRRQFVSKKVPSCMEILAYT